MVTDNWQETYVSNLQTMISAMDEHVTQEDAARVVLELLATLAPELEGATVEPAEGAQTSSAGEFAARWNTLTPEWRDRAFKSFKDAQEMSMRCFIEDHDQLKRQVNDQFEKLGRISLVLESKEYYEAKPHKAQDAILRIIDIITGSQPKATNWIIEYAHPNCQFCEGAAEEAIAHAEETGAPGATAVGIAIGDGMVPTDHSATVLRAS